MAASATPRHSTTFPDGRSSTSRTRSSTGRQTSRAFSTSCRARKARPGACVGVDRERPHGDPDLRGHDRGVLVPWNSWRHEFYKPMGTLHDADRGGFIFAPEVGLHENVHELDFSSLYPNIICTRNVSPDVIRCDCQRPRRRPRTRVLDLRRPGLPRRRFATDHRRTRRDQGGHPSREGSKIPTRTVWRNSRDGRVR